MTGEGYKLIKNQDEYLKYQSDSFQKKILHVSTFVSLHRKALEARISNQYSVHVGLGIALLES